MKKSSIVALSIVGVLVILIVGVVGWGISANNRFVELEETAASAKSDIDTVLQRRADLIPNLVATVKGYAQHEEEVINAVSDARAKLAGASTTEDKLAANDELSSALSRLLVVVENYPDLKASQNFIDLQTQLEGTENRIARSRQEYNDAVPRNTMRRSVNSPVPSSPVCRALKRWSFSRRRTGRTPRPRWILTDRRIQNLPVRGERR